MKKTLILLFFLMMTFWIVFQKEEKTKPVIKEETFFVLQEVGYKEEEIETIMNRLTDQEIELLKKNNYIEGIQEYLKLDYFIFDNLNRYLAYQKQTKQDLEKIVTYVNIGLDKDFYDKEITSLIEIPNETTVLVNKYHQLSKDYEPKLETITKGCGIGRLQSVAKEAFEKLCIDAKTIGYTISSISAYRSYDYQQKLYENYVSQDGILKTDTYSARPGHSEHQTGLALDIAGKDGSYLYFEQSKEFPWVKENAHLYGFIIRYPKEKENITGYQYEPWHIRYVGKEIATYIYENDITYDEYYTRFLEKKI